MNHKFYRHRLFAQIIVLTLFVSACKKDASTAGAVQPLAPSSVFIKEAAMVDTLSSTVSSEKDSITTVKLEAGVKNPVSGAHTVTFAVDTTLLATYTAKYGAVKLLPANNYFVAFSTGNLQNGETSSSSAEINIANTSQLSPGTTYILPIVLSAIDNEAVQQPSAGQLIFMQIRVRPIDYGIPIVKTGWTIVTYSSELSGQSPAYLLDNNPSTYWASNLNAPMPQFVTIDMGQSHNLKAVSFQNWNTSSSGANPTQIMIELSTDGTNWINAGTYAGGTPTADNVVHNLKINPVAPARYIRFTVLQATSYFGVYTVVALSEIGANQ